LPLLSVCSESEIVEMLTQMSTKSLLDSGLVVAMAVEQLVEIVATVKDVAAVINRFDMAHAVAFVFNADILPVAGIVGTLDHDDDVVILVNAEAQVVICVDHLAKAESLSHVAEHLNVMIENAAQIGIKFGFSYH